MLHRAGAITHYRLGYPAEWFGDRTSTVSKLLWKEFKETHDMKSVADPGFGGRGGGIVMNKGEVLVRGMKCRAGGGSGRGVSPPSHRERKFKSGNS